MTTRTSPPLAAPQCVFMCDTAQEHDGLNAFSVSAPNFTVEDSDIEYRWTRVSGGVAYDMTEQFGFAAPNQNITVTQVPADSTFRIDAVAKVLRTYEETVTTPGSVGI